jgi:hypothetical protein
MPFNGSGTYTLPAGNPVISGTVISSVTHNLTMSDLATALTNCITKDGQTAITGNINLNSHKVVNLTAGTVASDAVRYDQVMLLSGVNAMAANMAMGNHKITGLAVGTNVNDATSVSQVYTDCVLVDGANAMTGNLPMASHKLTGLAAGTTAGDSVRYEQVAKINESTGANSDIKSLTGLTTHLTVAQGGTGATTLADNQLIVGNGTSALSTVSNGSFGHVLVSNGPSSEPSFQDFSITGSAPPFLILNSGII